MRDKALPQVRKFLEHENPRVRAAAIAGLGQSANPFALSDLLDMLRDPDPAPRIAAAEQIFRLRDAEDRFDSFADHRASEGVIEKVELASEGSIEAVELVIDDGPGGEELPAGRWQAMSSELAAWLKSMAAILVPGGYFDLPAEAIRSPRDIFARALAEGYGDMRRWTRQHAQKNLFVPPLRKMLESNDIEEKLAAGMALASLGHGETAMPKLFGELRAQPDLLVRAVGVLTHLPWEQRVAAFTEFRKLAQTNEQRIAVIRQMQEAPDRRLTTLFWPMLEEPDATEGEAEWLAMGIRAAHVGERYGDITVRVRKSLLDDARPRTAGGTHAKRLAALWLLAVADRETAAEVAAEMIDDASLSAETRRDVLRLLLYALPERQASQRAVAELRGGDALRRKSAVLYLVGGQSAVLGEANARSFGYLTTSSTYRSYGNAGPIVPEAPAGVEVDAIRPLLADEDAKIAASAGYLLALLGDGSGLEQLLAHWRENRDTQTDRLAYRAIASLDAVEHLPELETIFATLKEDYNVREFYWTIRIMTGDKVLAFRKRIRDEVGMNRLR
jgi:hypothetical protein